MSWNSTTGSVHNYADGTSGRPELPQKIISGVARTRCECGRWVQAFRIVDTSDLPEEVTRGQKWACDNCWTSWIRHDPRHQRAYQGRPFRLLDWLELHGAPAAVIARQLARDAKLHRRMLSKISEIAARGDDDSRKRELARMNDNLDRMVDRVRAPAV